jgi:hypothetical protein
LSKPAFHQAWNHIKKDTKFGKKFEGYIESMLLKENPL